MVPDEILHELRAIHESQEKTNQHLAQLNGKVAKHEQWIAVRTDREERDDERGSKALSARNFYIAQAIVFGMLVVGIIALVAGAHGAS